MKEFILGLLLWAVAVVLILPLTLINFGIVAWRGKGKGYFIATAVNLDRFGNYEFRTLWNATLIRRDSVHRFGNFEETISSVLGKNQRAGTLSTTGRGLGLQYECPILDIKKISSTSVNHTLV